MIWITIMLFMIGQNLNMPTAYWIMWGLYIFCHTITSLISTIKTVKELEEKNS